MVFECFIIVTTNLIYFLYRLHARKGSYMKEKNKKVILRILVYILGLFVLAMGITTAINSNLGVSPVSSLPYVFSVITGMSMGMWTILVYLVFVLVQMLLLKKEFKIRDLSQLLFSFVFGYFINFTSVLLERFVPTTYPGQLGMALIAVFLIALGVELYVSPNIVNMPMEAMCAAVNKKVLKKLAFGDVKVIMDSLIVVISIIVSLVFLGKVIGVREGTILNALLVGQLMKPIHKVLRPLTEKLV